MRLAVLISHPIQYHAPVFRALAQRCDLHVFYAHRTTPDQQASAGFGVAFDWDIDLLQGHDHSFLNNVAGNPDPSYFWGCDTPEIGKRLRDGKFDALLIVGWYLKCYWQAVWAAKYLAIPVLARGDSHLETPRGLLKRTVKTAVYPVALRAFDVGLYVGERSREYWQHYRFPAHRLVFSPHCVDNDWFSARASGEVRKKSRELYGISRDAKVVLFAGKFVSFKRPLDVISATKILNSNGYDLTVLTAGSGPLGNQLAAAATSTKVPLIQLGFCNQTEMPAAYAAADLLVLPSDGHETWGLVANEALACGKPIVVSDACGCAPDLAADKAAGRVFPLGDIPALAASIKELIEAPPSREVIAAKVAHYNISAAVDGILAGAALATKLAAWPIL